MDEFAERPGIRFTAPFKTYTSATKCTTEKRTTINGYGAIRKYNQAIMEKLVKQKIVKNLVLMTFIGIVLGYLSPFGMTNYPLYVNVLYWVLACYLGYSIFAPIISFFNKVFDPFFKKKWARVAIGAFVASIVMTITMPILTWLFFDIKISLADEFTSMFPRILLIGGVITIIALVRERLEIQKADLLETKAALEESEQIQQAALYGAYDEFMLQLPLEKRGQLLCLEMDDHYINVSTDKGKHMVLMRFKDALTLLKDYPGLQTHRSWWVAKDAIVAVDKVQRKLVLSLSNGTKVPVSRTFEKQVKEAGFAE